MSLIYHRRQGWGDLSPGLLRPAIGYSRKEIVISPKHIDLDQLRGIQGICEREQGSHTGSTAIPCFSARRVSWRYPNFD